MSATSAKMMFHFPIAILLQVGDTIVNAAKVHQAELAARLPELYVGNSSSKMPQRRQADAVSGV